MKKIVLFSAIALSALVYGCADEHEQFGSEGIGRIILSPEIKSDVTVASRAVDGEDNLRESLVLWISNEDKVIRKYKGASSIPEKDWLASGEYLAEAWAGDSVSATFDLDKRWFKGSSRFSVSALQTTEVKIPCKIANVLVNVVFDSYIKDNLKDINITVGHSKGQLEYTPEQNTTGYFMMPSTDKDLKWTLTATRVEDGVAIKKTGTIKGAKRATLYTLIVHANVDDREIGGGFFGVNVDITMQQKEDEFIVEVPPVIKGYGFNPDEGAVFKEGQIGDQAIFILACADISSAKLTLKDLSKLLGGITDRQGNSFETIDFITIGDDLKSQIEAAGIDWEYEFYEKHQSATLKVNFREKFNNNLKEGDYDFIFEITDTANPPRTTNQTIHVRVSNDIMNLMVPDPYDVWSTKAKISAVPMQEDHGNVGFEYHKKGESSWTSAAAIHNAAANTYSADLTGLTPGTTYEYRVISDMDNYASNPLEFTTEAPLQLENAGFEGWQQPKNTWLPCGAGEKQFWDSGNHGATTLGKDYNICIPAEDIINSGKRSAHLVSRWVVMKFAAGNIFAGEYLGTDGTDGILGWGIPFTSRPKALKGYVKYKTGKINRGTAGNIPGKPVASGDNDQGIIYVALLDNTISKSYGSKTYPVIIKTKTTELFSQNDPNVLGYGEQVWFEDTAGEGMIPFTIPINYDGKPHNPASYIVVTCSASRYGDYFVGSDSAEMWIDDLELVYE
ncbi:MAG: DUF4493 domain-containing protein [Muribaculaceae bacterium]|nr:DUF4493 domain-containing protein [Muribaculaceae bacterium]MDE6703712.1 DUF4493 domain-containing protein [Muribaculaceae bacterium]